MAVRLPPWPRCQTCGASCKRRYRTKRQLTKFCSHACVPHAQRVAMGRKGRAAYAYQKRAARYRAELARIEGGRLTAEDLFAMLARAERTGYLAGFKAGRKGAVPSIAEYTTHETEAA